MKNPAICASSQLGARLLESGTAPPWDNGPLIRGAAPTGLITCDNGGLAALELLRKKAEHYDELVAALVRIRGLIAEDALLAHLIAREVLLKVPT